MEYQEITNLYIEKIASTNQQLWRSIYEVIDDSYFKVVKLFPTEFLDKCKNIPNQPQNISSEVKAAFFKWLWKMVFMHKWLLYAKESQMIKSKKIRQKYITSKNNQQDQNIGLILMMSDNNNNNNNRYHKRLGACFKLPNILIARFTFTIESINCIKIKSSLMSFRISKASFYFHIVILYLRFCSPFIFLLFFII